MKLLAVFTTVASVEQARELARVALQRRLAACVQISGIESLYPWQGELQQEAEQRVLFKTTETTGPALMAMIRERHPYELPAIHAVELSRVDEDYAAWVAGNVSGPTGTPG